MPTRDPAKRRAQQARWRAKNADRHTENVRWAKILAKYGLTRDEWHRLLSDQGGRCAICRSGAPGGRGQWHVDHDHVSGKARGLLCNLCNRGLGLFRDDPDLLERASSYLKRTQVP